MTKIIEIKKQLNSSNDGKTVFANFGYLTLLQIAGYVFPLISMPYLARVIGTDGFGKIAFASAVVVWFQTVTDWGFNLTATRDVAQHRDDKEKVSQIFSNVLWSRCLLMLISGFILLLLVAIVPYFRENAVVILITFLMIPGYILFPDWMFQAIEKMKYTTIFNLLMKLLFTVAVFIFIHKKEDYIIQPLLSTIGYLICGIGALYLILHKWGYTLYRPKWKEISKTIKGSTDVFINNIMPNFYNSFSVLLLGFFGGSTANGLFDGGNKFPTILYQFQAVLSRAFYPFLARRLDKQRLGGIKPEEAKHHPDKNIITRAIGAKADVDVDFYEHRLKRGDIILMCTDGLSNMVEDEELFHIVQGSRDIVEAGEMLVEAAKENGGTDNIGVVLFEPFADEVSV